MKEIFFKKNVINSKAKYKATSNQLAADIKIRKAQISKLIQSGGFLRAVLSKLAAPIMKIVATFIEKILLQVSF